MTIGTHLRRAITAIFVVHIVKTGLALGPAIAIARHTTWAPGSVRAAFGPETILALAASVATTVRQHTPGHPGPTLVLIMVLVWAPLAHAWWLRTMAGDNPLTGLRNAVRSLPLVLLLVVFHVCLQGLWGAAAYQTWVLIDLQVGSLSQPRADAYTLVAFCIWGTGAGMMWTWADLALARRLTQPYPDPTWLLPDSVRRLLRDTALKVALRGAELGILMPAFVATALTWPGRVPLVVLAVHQLCALAVTFLRAAWCATTCRLVSERPRSRP